MTPTLPIRRITLKTSDSVAIVAGSGRLPARVAEALAEQGHRPFIYMVRGEADAQPALSGFDHEYVALGEFTTLVRRMQGRGQTHLVLAGGIGRRPRWREISVSSWLLRKLPKAILGLASGDDNLLGALVRAIEDEGIKVVGAHEVAPDLLAAEGPLTRCKPLKADKADLAAAYKAARAIGALDVGQAAVSVGGRVIALEGIEGTDGLLSRVAVLRSHGRLAGKKRGVLVKCAKPGQELRADLPSIGPATVDAAHAAGLAGIGVEAGRAIVLDNDDVVARADALGLFVVGLEADAP